MTTLELIREGERFYSDGDLEAAEHRFLKALDDDPRSAEAHNNLAVLALQKRDFAHAAERIRLSLEIDPYNRDAVLNMVEVSRALGAPENARPALERFLNHATDPELSALLRTLDAPALKWGKLAFLCAPGLESFLEGITGHFADRCDIRTAYSGRNDEINTAVAWADTIWVEWANEMAVALSHGLPVNIPKRVICRLHSYEAFAGYASRIKWERIDDLVFVAEHIRDYVLTQIPDLTDQVKRIHVIPNGVDMSRFALRKRQPGKHLAFLGYINYKKGPMLLLHAFAELVRRDPSYHLHLGGQYQDERYPLYFAQMARELGLTGNLHFDGWISDINTWLADKQYIVCSSVLESQGMGIMEAMACGVKPLVHNFVGARTIYERHHVWNSIPEFVDMVMSSEYNSQEYRDFVAERYSRELQLSRLDNLLSLDTTDQDAPESYCGAGSYLANTGEMQQFLSDTLKERQVKTMIDVGCGDLNWLRHVDLTGVDYTGYDLDEGFIRASAREFPHLKFVHADIRAVEWPKVDLVLCRDVLIHLNHADILKLLAALKASGAKYLITTTYPDVTENRDFTPGQKRISYTRERRVSRKLNLQLPPFELPGPIATVRENDTEACQGRLVGLWRLSDYAPPKHPLVMNYAGRMYACSANCHACMDDQYEREDAEFAKRFIRPGGTVLDIGAHAGLYSVLANTLMNGRGEIHAFEMEDYSWEVLQKTASMYPAIKTHHHAVWSKNTKLAITLSSAPGLHYVMPTGRADAPVQHEVEAIPLDSFFPADFKVDFVKLDIEGSELHALRGMEKILRRSAKVGMVIEFVKGHLARHGQTPGEVVVFLERLGFRCENLPREFLISGLADDQTVKAHYVKG